MTFKQKYLHQKGPFPFDFDAQRKEVFQKIIHIFTSYPRNSWNHYGFNPIFLVDQFKQIYGLQPDEMVTLINILVGYFANDPSLTGEISTLILKVLNRISEYDINIDGKLTINNQELLCRLENMSNNGNDFPPKTCDQFLEEFLKFILAFSKYGQDCTPQLIEMAIKKKDIRLVAFFISSVKNKENANKILQIMFIESSLWERDTWWFFILSKLTKNFPDIDYTQYHQTLFHETIKIITTLIQPLTEDDVKRILNHDSSLRIPSILSSMTKILTTLLISENSEPIWSAIERIFSIFKSSLDHVNYQNYVTDFFLFMKQFVKSFTNLYRNDRKLHLKVNQDYVEVFHGTNPQFKLKEEAMERFDNIWPSIIPKLLHFEDQDLNLAKILSQLAMYKPEKFLAPILNSILEFLEYDLTLVSLHTSKTTILFLQQFVILKFSNERQMNLLLECCNGFLIALEKLGISENIDLLQLVMKNFTYLPEEMIDNVKVQSLMDDLNQIVLHNLNAISTNLDDLDGEETEIYIEFKNFFFPFILRFDDKQLLDFSDKFTYKLKEGIPSNKAVYEMITSTICFINKNFSKIVVDFVYKNLVEAVKQKEQNKNGFCPTITENQRYPESVSVKEIFPYHLNKRLHTKNEENVNWFSLLLQCATEYSPKVIAEEWEKIQTILVVMFREWDDSFIFEKGLDILFNIIMGLNRVHLSPEEFKNDKNRKYETLNNIKWMDTPEEGKKVLQEIHKKFYLNLITLVKNRYQSIVDKSDKAQNLRTQKVYSIKPTSIKKVIETKQKYSELLDNLITPSVPNAQDLEEKKLLYKIISIQYTVFSALLLRAPYTPSSSPISPLDNFYHHNLGEMRKQGCVYVEWLIQVLSFYNCLWDPTTLKVVHYFWRQAHDEFYFTALLATTNEKLNSYFYPQINKKKELFNCSFLILNEAYLIYVMRVEFLNQINETAYLNNPSFMQKMVPFSFCSALQCTFKTLIPISVDSHRYHEELLALCRFKLSAYHPESYVYKYINSVQKNQKEKYISAIRSILNNVKKCQTLFNSQCCIQDEKSWYAVLQILEVYPYLQSKADKVIFLQVIYLILIFNFDFKGRYLFDKGEGSENRNALIMENIIEFIKKIINQISQTKEKNLIPKNKFVMILILLLFSEFIDLQHPLMEDIIKFVLQLSIINSIELNNIVRTFLFRIINRFLRSKTKTTDIQNVPVKRKFDEFLIYRYMGGYEEEGKPFPLERYTAGKSDNYYYPLKTIKTIQYGKLEGKNKAETLLLEFITSKKQIRAMLSVFTNDTSLKANETEDISSLVDEESKRIYSNGHKLVNFILDSNPLLLDIFNSFLDNFSSYPVCFYQRLFRKMLKLGKEETLAMFKQISNELLESTEVEQIKLGIFISIELLPFCLQDHEYMKKYVAFLTTCSNENYQFTNSCLIILFSVNFVTASKIFNHIISELRKQKGSARLRHLSFFNNYILCQGRFGRQDAVEGITYLMKGIDEGSNQVSDLIVSMLLSCFIISINLEEWQEWVEQKLEDLLLNKKLYKLDRWTGYEIEPSLRELLKQISNKTQQEKDIESKNLQIYSRIVYQILSSITVFRFNDVFYDVLKGMILYVVNRPTEQDSNDEQILTHLKNSEYPEEIYNDLISSLMDMEGCSANIIKKKIKFIEGLAISRSFCKNKIQIPQIIHTNQKSITFDHIVASSNIVRLMKDDELNSEVQKSLSEQKNIYKMMILLLAAGVRPFQWREPLLKQIVKVKKLKIVKEFVSGWWKGKSPETQEEQRLYRLVSSVENPYSYFA